MLRGIAIVGLNGSGKTTLGHALAERLGYFSIDVEDYYFPKSDVPYSVSRTRDEVEKLMLADIRKHGNFVLSAVCADFGEEINSFYGLIVYLEAPLEVRMSRIRQRSIDKFGDRVLPGGDMHRQEEAFFDFAAARTSAKTDAWLASTPCPVLRVDGTKEIDKIVRLIEEKIKE